MFRTHVFDLASGTREKGNPRSGGVRGGDRLEERVLQRNKTLSSAGQSPSDSNKTWMLTVPQPGERLNGVIIFEQEQNLLLSLTTTEEVLTFFQEKFPQGWINKALVASSLLAISH